ncbi:peptidoglycan DD-metalloendopeptidase family protein [Candidatus Parcubacteria bacterium]|nr:peptidoglycan DD-metalloendopeptidase family protein [Candidatus Parcubacteria bacterium]
MDLSKLTVIPIIIAVLLVPTFVHAQSADTIKEQIDASNAAIQKLKDEISQLQGQLNETSKQKQTFQSAVKELDLNIQKLTKSISLTQAQIKQKDEEIGDLGDNITDTSGKIGNSHEEVADSIRQLDAMDNESSAVMLLGGGTLSSFFDEAANLATVRQGLQLHIEDLSALKSNLVTSKTSAEDKRKELAGLQRKLATDKQGLSSARAEQSKLLAETQSKESQYQVVIAQKKAQEASFEADLSNYEAQLKLIVDPSSIPKGGALLQWPVDQPYITQYFGNTPFATANAQIYGGKGHNAIDLRALPGTPVKAARAGRVIGAGNTDLTCPNASYGKWVFIQHDNGLSTLYAHLSQINVSEGQTVSGGQVLGFSGSTGYATGPHLHFGVYSTSGSKVTSFPSKSCAGRIYTMPVADIKAYLNPLTYLPKL